MADRTPSIAPPRATCCRRGYWNAIAYGAAVLWVIYVSLASLWLVVPSFYFGDFPTLWTIYAHLRYIHPMSDWLGNEVYYFLNGLFTSHGIDDMKFWERPWRGAINATCYAFAASLQWIVLLAALRLHWWTRRAPVTGRSVIAAVIVMAAIIAVSIAVCAALEPEMP